MSETLVLFMQGSNKLVDGHEPHKLAQEKCIKNPPATMQGDIN